MKTTANREAAETEYAKAYAEAVAAGIMPTTTPEETRWWFAETDAEVVAEIENATQEIRDAIEQREFYLAQIAEQDADVAKHEERGRRKSQGQHDAKIEAQRREINALRLKLAEAERERDAARRYIIDQHGK